MTEFVDRICSLNIDLFNAIPTQTTDDDRRSLLVLQRCVRESGDYEYLEIGSHLGGTIQPYYVDPRCKLIYSIDKRPLLQPDERGRTFEYSANSTAKMLTYLKNAFPFINAEKLRTFDCDACDVNPTKIAGKPNICFIDGEHTNTAVRSDFNFCLKICHPNAIIAFHDACLVFEEIERIKNYLHSRSIQFQGFMPGGCIYAILLNEAVNAYADKIEFCTQSESDYFKQARKDLWKSRLINKIPLWRGIYKWCREFTKSLLRKYPLLYRAYKWYKRSLTGRANHGG